MKISESQVQKIYKIYFFPLEVVDEITQLHSTASFCSLMRKKYTDV